MLRIIAKPGLERWRRETPDADRIASEAAEVGTAIHAAIEASFRSERVPDAYKAHVSAVHTILHDNYPEVAAWTIEHRFAHPDGFGGCVDIHNMTEALIGDHKGAAFGPDDDKQLAYDQFWQLGGYAEGLNMPEHTRGFNLFISRTHPGHVRLHEWSPAKMRQGRAIFRDTLRLWKSLKNFDGSWT